MTSPQAILLGLIQGVTEFLPVSSSAHLILTSFLLGWEDQGLVFDVAVHLGSMLAVVIFVRHELLAVLRSLGARGARGAGGPGGADGERAPDAGRHRRLGLALVVGTVPVAVAGILLRGLVETSGREPILIASTSIVYGIALLLADRLGSRTRSLDGLGWRDALAIGVGQALALIPGTSRAGATMTVALALGYDRASAARFSFLLAVPVSLLVGIGQLVELASQPLNGIAIGQFLLGFVASGVAAYLSIGFLINWVKRQDYSLFVAYRVVLGLVILVSVWR